ncbi:LOW QUALITY PROTEIN: olfactory receptor 11G2-like [Nannospalax galili]|uniref:LOW QUALITY PROTEIN: olfactory receptor 11G2-like n=1 Tax=Nannospalax galili TaxID=1026970 RepID=UPI000819F325|nr:LOW QUALITY PROTEIN: olfactory receptor 11G2-like [Nannospalax galili]
MPISDGKVTAAIHEFILLGFQCSCDVEILLFILFSIIHILTLLGNGTIICAVWWDPQLQTSMHTLLAKFSFLEICYINSSVPNMLFNFFSKAKTISYSGCILQFYIFFSLCATELFFLALMAFDRYVTISCPLHYPIIMTKRICGTLVLTCWVGGFLWLVTPTTLVSEIPFCGSNIIDHYLCDLGALLAISCVPVTKTSLTCSTFSAVIVLITLFYILLSCTLVLRAVVQAQKSSGGKKSFSTCASHLAVVSLFYGSVVMMYVSPGAANQPGLQKFVSMFYSIVTPLLNPLICNLRNKEMKVALRKAMCKV